MLKLKETAVENGQYLKIYPQGVLNVCVLIWTTKQSQLNAGYQTLWTRLISEFQIGFYIYFKLLKKTDSGLKMVLKSNWICPQQILCSFLNNKTVAIKVSQEKEVFECGEKSWTSLIQVFFCRFTFKSINHEVDNLASRRIIGTLSCTQYIVIVNC